MWGITSSITDAFKQAPAAFLQGISDAIIKPPQKLVELWDGLSEEDKELFKKAAMAGLRVGARALIAYADGGKVNF